MEASDMRHHPVDGLVVVLSGESQQNIKNYKPAEGLKAIERQEPITGKSINKKAYVRFDDYLDLNEENMRRSCKKLMNHLYSEASAGPACGCCPAPCPANQMGGPLPAAPEPTPGSPKSLSPTSGAGAGKSYLRSQYERRQQRQLQITTTNSNMQQPQSKLQIDRQQMARNVAGRDQQQDLVVAKSHELSKRRFFEKLERRESMKNFHLGTQSTGAGNPKAYSSLAKQPPGELLSPANRLLAPDGPMAPSSSSSSSSTIEPDELGQTSAQVFLKLRPQSILPGSRQGQADTMEISNSKGVEVLREEDTLRELAGAPATATGRLIAPNSASLLGIAPTSGRREELSCSGRLIDLDWPAPAGNRLLVAGEEAYEIRVPGAEAEAAETAGEEAPGAEALVCATRLLFVREIHCDDDSRATNQSANKSDAATLVDLKFESENRMLVGSEIATTEQRASTETIHLGSIKDNKPAAARLDDSATTISDVGGGENKTQTSQPSGGLSEADGTTGPADCEQTTDRADAAFDATKDKREAGGSTAQDHEEPETCEPAAAPLEQSARQGHLAQATDAKRHPAESAEQQVAPIAGAAPVNGRRRPITTPPTPAHSGGAIRDAPPEAPTGEINRCRSASLTEIGPSDKVAGESARQHNEPADINAAQQVNDSNGTDNGRINREQYGQLDGQNKGHLIESFGLENEGAPSTAAQVHSQTQGHEDCGSSCESSGFGASGVSVTCSSSASSSSSSSTDDACSPTISHHPGSLFGGPLDRENTEPVVYDTIRHRESHMSGQEAPALPPRRALGEFQARRIQVDFPRYKQLVGPDQAYPAATAAGRERQGRHVLIENHNYASTDSTRRAGALAGNSEKRDLLPTNPERPKGIVLARDDDYSPVRYANLPIRRPPGTLSAGNIMADSGAGAEYAKVKPRNNSARSLLSNASSSNDSGGFSKLTPVQLDSSGNNFPDSTAASPSNSNDHLKEPLEGKKAQQVAAIADPSTPASHLGETLNRKSLLKRFGTLVSRAFTSSSGPPPAGPIYGNNSANQVLPKGSADNSPIEAQEASSLSVDKKATGKQLAIDEVDLVILPTKHVSATRNRSQRHNHQLQQKPSNIKRRLGTRQRQSRSASPSTSSRSSSNSSDFRSAQTLQCRKQRRLRSASSAGLERQPEMESLPAQRRSRLTNTQRRQMIDIDCPARSTHKAPTSLVSNKRGANLTSGESANGPFWRHFSNSLIGQNHAIDASLCSSNLIKPVRKNPKTIANELGQPGASEAGEAGEKAHSLKLYKNLLRNYTNRRQRNSGERRNTVSHHNNQGRAHHGCKAGGRHSLRRTANSSALTSSSSLSARGDGQPAATPEGANGESVWGQLIKINKSDGSQVIELERLAGKSWGFFVARGAINNTRGIFISRMQDHASSRSLIGLLSIGDRILAIDESPIEQDYDILRVNQMISKRSKILLKVKPFRG